MTDQGYPELENIPPAPPLPTTTTARASRVNLVPRWAAAIFSTFPLHAYPAAKAYSPTTSPPPSKPTLYVAPHLNRNGTLSAVYSDDPHISSLDEKSLHTQPAGWSSSDPIALRWQMELLFHSVDYEVRFIDPSANWGPAKSMPFLHLPPRFRSGTATSSSLLTALEIPHLLDNYYPNHRPELGGKAVSAYPDKVTDLEAQTWVNLLQGRIMAGVLLAVLLAPQSAVYAKHDTQPYLSGLVASQMQSGFFDQQLRRVSALNPGASTSSGPTSVLPGWEVGFLGWIGATTASATSALSTADLDSRGGGDTHGAAFASPSVDQERVIIDAEEGLRALGARVEAELNGDDGMGAQAKWLLNATRASSLDALAFSVVHTLGTLAATPQAQEGINEPLRRLKAVLDEKPWLPKWSRGVWKEYVRDLDRA